MLDLLFICLAALAAGVMDAIIGGGGLLLLPALLDVLPQHALADVLALNKAALLSGTVLAAWRYTHHTRRRAWQGGALPRGLPLAALLAMVASWLGALAISHLSLRETAALRQALPFVLLALPIYVFFHKDLGKLPAAHIAKNTPHSAIKFVLIGLVMGFYDGFFGPGTGSLLMVAVVRLMGYDFLHASAAARLLCVATGLAALLYFGWQGHILWAWVLPLALANMAGGWLGTHLALRHGSGFVRWFFIVGVSVLVGKMLLS
ncbi:MAG: sulfite exporter TauE/SafE family protein [Brachymonas sp.]|jgi:uncharacterized membrane protein YfcA